MDWGLAKVLPEGGRRRRAAAAPAASRDRSSGRCAAARRARRLAGRQRCWARRPTWPRSRPGARSSGVDERADVFGLGAILCEILTGQPPSPGRGPCEVRAGRRGGDLADALARLDACGADAGAGRPGPRLPGRRAAGPAPRRRRGGRRGDGLPGRRAGAAAGRRAGAGQGRGAGRRGAQAAQADVALAVAIVSLVALGGGGGCLAEAAKRRPPWPAARVPIHGVEILRDQAGAARDDPARWAAAVEAARHVEIIGGDAGTTRRAGGACGRRAGRPAPWPAVERWSRPWRRRGSWSPRVTGGASTSCGRCWDTGRRGCWDTGRRSGSTVWTSKPRPSRRCSRC